MLQNKLNPIYLLSICLLLFSNGVHAQMDVKKSLVQRNAEVKKVADGFSFTEGPAVNRPGHIFFTDQPNDKIHKWNFETGEVSTFMEGAGRSNGLYFTLKGQLISCADMYNQLWSIDDEGNHKVLVESYKGNKLNGPNDVWVSPKGDMYFTDPLYKREYWDRDPEMQQDGEHLYYLSEDGLQLIRVDEKLVKPNGIVGTPDGKKLYVADIGDKKTYVYDIEEDGYLTNRQLFTDMGSDGMTIDNRGNVYLTGDGVTIFNNKGNKIGHIPIDAKWTANVCFGGGDRKTLFITAMDAVYTLQMKVRGVW
ncbi:SMP-30/gluconolactonase/LRE family protein [Pleomorphovibrio marinus]|uniref:SMP-30/gluconolactonase/LRE family protein n=1 Tax=Pleomorphovibrio marinus TaxID=2164132 RepID=UPI000E0AA15F|nr:SMP-30/gluconolactonase/LRE family protein [Pleomorphovibrio marinus]